MKVSIVFACALLSGYAFGQTPATQPRMLPRMVSPSIDIAGQPFSYTSQPTDQISVMHATAGTEITPEGYLYTGYGELMFFVGIDRQPIHARIRTLEDGYLPIVHYTMEHAGVEYRFTAFAASLGAVQDGTRVANFVRIVVRNPTASPKRAFLSSAWRYQADQTTPYSTGDNRFERPVIGKRPGDASQTGAPFRPDAVYTATKDAYLQNGSAIYFFPTSFEPFLRPTFRDFYNLLDLGPVGLKNTATPATPVANAEFEVALAPGEERSLDFKMPLAPLAQDSEDYRALEAASFDEKRKEVRAFWEKLLARGISIQVPEAKVVDTYKTSLVNDLMSLNKVGDDYVQTINQLHYHGFYLRDSADFVRMYDTSGYPDIGRQVVDFFATRQRPDGNFLSQDGQYDGWGQTIWTYGEHYRITHDLGFAGSVYPRILRAMDWLEGALAKDPLHIMPATDVRDNEFVPGHLTGYNFLALNGLQAAELLAHDLGHAADEARFRAIEERLRKAFLQQLEKASAAAGGKIPPSLEENAGGTDWGNLLSVTPEEQLQPFDPKVTATLRDTQSRYQEGLMTYHQDGQGTFLHHYLTIKNTLTELVRGDDEQAIRELYAVLLHTSSTNAGFEYSIRPWGDRDFSGNLAPHGWFAAEYRNLLRNMMVRERGQNLHLLSAVSPEWIGAGKKIQVDRAASYFGQVAFGLEMKDETSAVFTLSMNRQGAYTPKEVFLHIPWFLENVTATANGKALSIQKNAVSLPAGARRVEFHWKKVVRGDDPHSYNAAVDAYKAEYRRRYEALTGDTTR